MVVWSCLNPHYCQHISILIPRVEVVSSKINKSTWNSLRYSSKVSKFTEFSWIFRVFRVFKQSIVAFMWPITCIDWTGNFSEGGSVGTRDATEKLVFAGTGIQLSSSRIMTWISTGSWNRGAAFYPAGTPEKCTLSVIIYVTNDS